MPDPGQGTRHPGRLRVLPVQTAGSLLLTRQNGGGTASQHDAASRILVCLSGRRKQDLAISFLKLPPRHHRSLGPVTRGFAWSTDVIYTTKQEPGITMRSLSTDRGHHCRGRRPHLVQTGMRTPPHPTYVSLNQLLEFSEPQFTHLSYENGNATSLTGDPEGSVRPHSGSAQSCARTQMLRALKPSPGRRDCACGRHYANRGREMALRSSLYWREETHNVCMTHYASRSDSGTGSKLKEPRSSEPRRAFKAQCESRAHWPLWNPGTRSEFISV